MLNRAEYPLRNAEVLFVGWSVRCVCLTQTPRLLNGRFVAKGDRQGGGVEGVWE